MRVHEGALNNRCDSGTQSAESAYRAEQRHIALFVTDSPSVKGDEHHRGCHDRKGKNEVFQG